MLSSLHIYRLTCITTRICSLVVIFTIFSYYFLSAQDAPDTKPNATLAAEKNSENDKQLSGTIYFYNGNSLSGKILSWDQDRITIANPDLVGNVTFSTAKILSVALDSNRSMDVKLKEKNDETSLVINHRDKQKGLNGMIKGNFSYIDDETVTLNTSYAGEITIKKKFITRMEIDSKEGYLYYGPNSLDEWHDHSSEQGWKFQHNALISGENIGNIAKNIGIPEAAILSFDLSWKDDEVISLYFYSSDHEMSRPDHYYQLTIQRGNPSMIKYTGGRRVSHLTSEKRNRGRFNNFRQIPRNNVNNRKFHANYTLYMNKAKGIFHVYKDGIKQDTFTDHKVDMKNFGSALHLVSSRKTPIRIKNLRLARWSGHVPSTVDKEKFTKFKGKGERILLKNGDMLLANIGQIKDGKLQVKTPYAPLRIPIVRMRTIDLLNSEDKEEPIMNIGDIKCWFADKGWIILQPISIKDNILTAYHQALGENQFDLNIFKKIDFNIYDKSANSNRRQDSW